MTTESDNAPRVRSGFRDVLHVHDFAVLWGAEMQSIAGDQLARVALSFLVFDQTGSAGYTALTYALTYLPALFGGLVLGGLGDRYSRRSVIIACDLVRAALFALMALPGLSWIAVSCIVAVAVVLGPVFSASTVGRLAAVLDGERYRAATGLRMMTGQAAQVVGFACGGVIVALVHPSGALLIDAGTYLVSATVIAIGIRGDSARTRRPLPWPRRAPRPGGARSPRPSPVRQVSLWRDRTLRHLVLLSCLAGLFIVPEGLAVPFGHSVGAGTTAIGLLFAALPLGGAIGAVILVRLVPPQLRARLAEWMAIGCGVPLIVSVFHPMWPLAWSCWALSGVLAAYQVEVMSTFVGLVPDRVRSRLVARAGALLLSAQGLGVLAFGPVADYIGAGPAIAVAGGTGSLLALVLVEAHRRESGAPRSGTAEAGVLRSAAAP